MAASKERAGEAKKLLNAQITNPTTGQQQNAKGVANQTSNNCSAVPIPLLFIQPKKTEKSEAISKKSDEDTKKIISVSVSCSPKIQTPIQWVLEKNDFAKAEGFSSLPKNKALIDAIKSKKLDAVQAVLLKQENIAKAVAAHTVSSSSKNSAEIKANQTVLSDSKKNAEITIRKMDGVILMDSNDRADINTITTDGKHYNALQLAIILDWEGIDIFQLLVDQGININYTTQEGKTIWSMAQTAGRQDILTVLLKKTLNTSETSMIRSRNSLKKK